jgi:hypothetical protein
VKNQHLATGGVTSKDADKPTHELLLGEEDSSYSLKVNFEYPFPSFAHLFFFLSPSISDTIYRFNLLLLEYGEYFFEDLSVYLFPVPSSDDRKPFHQCDALKVQGRMKFCSRSIIFEPTDQRKPIIKYLFRSFRSNVEQYFLSKQDRSHCSVEVSGFFAFRLLLPHSLSVYLASLVSLSVSLLKHLSRFLAV